MDLSEHNHKIKDFVNSAKAYCKWAESEPLSQEKELKTAIRLLSKLYFSILELPDTEPDSINNANHSVEEHYEKWKVLCSRFENALPINHYSKHFYPYKKDDEEPVDCSLSDDFADIYLDLMKGLKLYDDGLINDAFDEWKSHFWSHWGRHLIGALGTLHCLTADEYGDTLFSSNPERW